MYSITSNTQTDPLVVANSLKTLSARSLELRETKTPIDVIKYRQGKQGKQWKYIDGITVQRWLDTNFPGWQWTVIPGSLQKFGGYINVAGTLKVPCLELGIFREITCYGSDEIEYSKTDGSEVSLDYAKAAETDALKRCVFRLGGFADVYSDTRPADMSIMLDEKDALAVLQRIPDFVAFFQSIRETSSEIFQSLQKFLTSIAEKTVTIEQAIEMINQFKESKGS